MVYGFLYEKNIVDCGYIKKKDSEKQEMGTFD